MGLALDSLFIDMLASDTTLMTAIGNRLYGTDIPVPDAEYDNTPVPYVIVHFDSLNNDETTKDNPYESDYDTVNISIWVCARNREELATLTQRIRRTILHEVMWTRRFMNLADQEGAILNDTNSYHLKVWRNYESMTGIIPEDYRFTAEGVQYDPMKPSFLQILNYSCDVRNELNYDEQEED